jgi:hypothetical protein
MNCGRNKFERPIGHWCGSNYRNAGAWAAFSKCLKNLRTSMKVYAGLPPEKP